MKEFYTYKINDVMKEVESSLKGLTDEEAQIRVEKYGKNALKESKKRNIFLRFVDQLKDVMIIVLLCAALVSGLISVIEGAYAELIDSFLILLIVVINAIIGLVQENKADAAMEALKNMSKPFVKVQRNGNIIKIKSENLTIGDIVILEAGDIVPADLRLIECASLQIEEAALTGESVASDKESSVVLKSGTPLGDRKNMAYSSSTVTYGRGRGVVVAIGMDTEVGKIANMLSQTDNSQTPLQTQLAKTAKLLSILVIGIALVIFVAAIVNNGFTIDSIVDSFMTAVAIAVAAIPEGLPAVVTIVLAMGVKKMSEKKAIVKNLPAVETLGCCEVICSDKTGTLTLNKMTVKQLYTISQGVYYKEVFDQKDDSVSELITGLTLCNDTMIGTNEQLVGDPTETALTAYALKIGADVKTLTATTPRIDELPFDSKRKLMTTVHEIKGQKQSYTKGAFDILLPKCVSILDNNEVRPITKDDIVRISNANKEMASNALRVLALAIKRKNSEGKELEKDLIFVGLVGMIDPPRDEVKGAVAVCKKAGMKAIMITGDHLDTAKAIAEQIGIYHEGDLAITGADLDKLSDEEFISNLHKYRVFARVSPENKVRIVKAFKSLKIIVAMTGDGVNDAPSIKIADIGVGMGITGTDVSKGAADMVLTDDNFATIIAAVEEGRKVYSNIKKAVQYLLSANIAEVLCLFIATIFLKVEFLSAVMILWINLVTDSLPALALGTEKAEPNIMEEKPRKAGSSLFAGITGRDIIIQGTIQTILTMLSFCLGGYLLTDGILDHKVAMTMAFVTLCFIQLFHAYNTRSQTRSLFATNPLSNRFLNISFIIGLTLVLSVTLLPFTQGFFGTTSLSWFEWIISIGCAAAIIPLVEIEKLIVKAFTRKQKRDKSVDAQIDENKN